MAGFRSVKKYTDAWEEGRSYTGHFRKATLTLTNSANRWHDLSSYGGGPVANYYASDPLTAATLTASRGIYHGDNKSPAAKWLAKWDITTNRAVPQQVHLLDYLLYYPFIDGDEAATQVFDNTVTLPRYTSGDGVKVMAVCVSPAVGNGQFSFNYINELGQAKTSPTNFCIGNGTPPVVGQIMTAPSAGATAGMLPFCTLAAGDAGVQSITDVTFSVTNGGLMCLALVKPLATLVLRDAGCTTEQEFITSAAGPVRIYDGAYLNIITNANSSLVGTALAGSLYTIWDEGT
jgi:hypothetical protein